METSSVRISKAVRGRELQTEERIGIPDCMGRSEEVKRAYPEVRKEGSGNAGDSSRDADIMSPEEMKTMTRRRRKWTIRGGFLKRSMVDSFICT